MYSWNTTIDDSSSILSYSPFSDGASLSGGWMPWYSDYPGNFIKTPGDDSEGTSIHYTSLPGASVVLQFEGSAVYVYGSANCSYMVTLDGTPITGTLNQSSVGLLFAQEGLQSTTHTVNLTVLSTDDAGSMLGLDQITFTNTINQTIDGLVPVHIDNTNDTALQYSGMWKTTFDSQIPSKAPAKYAITSDPDASVSLNVSGAVAVAINANRNWGHWTYNVSLGGESMGYNSSTYWLIGDTVLFYQMLIPSETYQVTLTNTGDQNYFQMTLNYFTVWMPNTTDLADSPSSASSSSSVNGGPTASGSPSSPDSTNTRTKTNVGAIVGPIVGISAALLLGVGFFMWWQRRRLTLAKEAETLETAAPFAPAARGELWYNGMEIGPGAPQPITYTAPVTSGKRAQMMEARVLQPAPPPVSTDTGSTDGRALWSTNPPSTAPQTVLQQSAAPPSSQVVDVNHIIELIAQRIDPAGRSNDDIAPPEYHVR